MDTSINTEANKDYLEELSNFIFTSKYARYREDLHRRETWEESVQRVLDMHLSKYAYLDKKHLNQIKRAFELVKQKKVVPSMRSMQFGGNAIFAHNARIFNCSSGHITSIRSFSEFFYLLLCGTGVTGGFSKKAISLLPKLVDDTTKTGTVITYVVEDTIEGWADSVEALMLCYFKNTAYSGRKIVFDYSRIRSKGTPLKTGGGKAPGHKGLKQAHTKIKEVLDYIIEVNGQTELKPINAYDILMHCADAVLSGGIRRAATMAIFDFEDLEMLRSKTNFNVTKSGGWEKLDNGKWEGFVNRKSAHWLIVISFCY
jgi:ribonucleoside-diphosphate reductase alpha chain